MTAAPGTRRDDLEREAAALVELGERSKRFPLYFYKPAPKMIAFHRSRARVRMLAGGNRSGKTEANVAEQCAYALGYRPWVLRELGLPAPDTPWIRPSALPEEALCFSGAGIRVQVPNDILLVTGQSIKKGIGETLHPKVKKLLGPLIKQEHMGHAGAPSDVVLKNGSRILYGSAEQGPLAFESTNHTSYGLDEPVPRRVFTGCRRGSIDQFAPICMTFTPLGPWAIWMWKDLYTKADSIDTPPLKRKIDVFNCSIFDNPYLPPEAVEEFAADPALSELERQARLYGKFQHLSDVIYATFNDKVHVVAPFRPPDSWFHGMVVDPHLVRPWAIAYFAVDPSGNIYFWKEWPPGDFTKMRADKRSVPEYAQVIRELDGSLPIQVRLMDPNAGPAQTRIREKILPSVQSELGLFGLYFNCAINDDLAYGEAKVRALLQFREDQPLSHLNRPHLFFTEDCYNCINSMLFYTFKVKLGGDNEPDELKRDESHKDFADLVRYTAVSGVIEGGSADIVDEHFGTVREREEEEAASRYYEDFGSTGYE